jgi:membrane-bound metal-dependent hydrolase YbcI (DUF457 family)
MANSREHTLWGSAAGVAAYIHFAYRKDEPISLSELLGSALSGILAAKVPDILEAATHPNHRSIFHGIFFAVLALPTAWVSTCKKREAIIGQAQECERRAAVTINNPERHNWNQRAVWLRFCAGHLLGLIPGYASHLAADALTPKGLPLLR